jgi:hypothetical protein
VDLPRRTLVVVGLGVLAAGCGGQASDEEPPAGSRPATTGPASTASGSAGTVAPTISTTGTRASSAALPDVTPWRPGPGELVPACKLAAVRRVERAGTGSDRAVQVIDAQYGGLLTDTASVLVVTRSWRRSGDHVVPGGHTYDVRLIRTASTWRVTAVHPSRPGPPAPALGATARRVLAADRIQLPPAAARDIESGRVHESVLTALLAVARSHRPSVSVVRSGHPLHVFGTTRLSDHPQGRAFDTWAIDGHPVVDPRTPRALVEDYMHAVAAAGSYNVGGPYLLGSAPQWFSDDTHHDHVHAGFAT